MAKARIGTSGWSYAHWVGPFYPTDLAADRRLAHYARQLGSTEINNTFYQLPATATLAHWRAAVPAEFVFAAKASRYITHMKKLRDADDTVPSFLARLAALGPKLGPVLFQLPPRWHQNTERLATFLTTLERLQAGRRWVFELRDHSWLTDATLHLLERHNAACCIYELDGFVTQPAVTADFVYIRLHGPDGAYRGRYDDAALDGWARRIQDWLGRGLDVYCYFDNDEAGYAVHNALALHRRLRPQ
ncbi:DUF72 domain-containing protein [uncultured Thiohalocapsa sp.]|uniref:DUF72 domain-containing protein n=1 Tax=uncultured Thiohalocapsa sp. TaxID=768990 RepID=UPI0025EC5059|nr:DUF72 domain-containing protein [uncultured Thiohalocapsa sp.]